MIQQDKGIVAAAETRHVDDLERTCVLSFYTRLGCTRGDYVGLWLRAWRETVPLPRHIAARCGCMTRELALRLVRSYYEKLNSWLQ